MDSLTADKRQELEHSSMNYNRTNVTLRRNFREDVEIDILLRFRNVVSRPKPLSGCEPWTLNKTEERRTELHE
jgi:hypothetical protein